AVPIDQAARLWRKSAAAGSKGNKMSAEALSIVLANGTRRAVRRGDSDARRSSGDCTGGAPVQSMKPRDDPLVARTLLYVPGQTKSASQIDACSPSTVTQTPRSPCIGSSLSEL